MPSCLYVFSKLVYAAEIQMQYKEILWLMLGTHHPLELWNFEQWSKGRFQLQSLQQQQLNIHHNSVDLYVHIARYKCKCVCTHTHTHTEQNIQLLHTLQHFEWNILCYCVHNVGHTCKLKLACCTETIDVSEVVPSIWCDDAVPSKSYTIMLSSQRAVSCTV